MTRADREHLLQRYLDGAMSSAEEEEFLIRAALNTDLRMELKAHQTIDRALRKDRTAGTVEHTALRGRVAASLAASPVPAESVPTEAAPTPPSLPTAVVAGGSVWSVWGGSALLGGLGLIVALVLTIHPFDSADPEPAIQPTNRVVAPAPATAPLTPPASSTTVEPQQRAGTTAPSAVRNGRASNPAAASRPNTSDGRRSGSATNSLPATEKQSATNSAAPRNNTRRSEPIDVSVRPNIELNKVDASKKNP